MRGTLVLVMLIAGCSMGLDPKNGQDLTVDGDGVFASAEADQAKGDGEAQNTMHGSLPWKRALPYRIDRSGSIRIHFSSRP